MKKFGTLRKLLALLVAALISVAALGGCSLPGNTPPTGSAGHTAGTTAEPEKPSSWISDTPITWTYLYSDNTSFPFREDWLYWEEITKRTNVTLKFQVVPDADYENKLRMMLSAGGELPNFIGKNVPGDITYAGILIPFSDYMDKLPNFSNVIETNNMQDALDEIRQADGKFYKLPGLKDKLLYDSGLFISRKALDKYGITQLSQMRTFDDLYSLMKSYKNDNPDSYPFSGFYGMDCLFFFMGPCYGVKGCGGWSAPNGCMTYNENSKKYELYYTTSGFKAMLEYLAKLYSESLLDPEIFTQSGDQYAAKLKSGTIIAAYTWGSGESENRAFPPLQGIPGVKATTNPMGRTGFSVSMPAADAKDPNFDKMLKFIDWLQYSEEGMLLSSWGVEGITYVTNTDDTRDWTDEAKAIITSNNTYLVKEYGFGNNNSIGSHQMFDALLSVALLRAPDPSEVNELNNYMNENDLFAPLMPQVRLNDDQMEEIKLLTTPLVDFANKTLQEFIFGKKSLNTDWDDFVNQLNSMGADEILKIYNDNLTK